MSRKENDRETPNWLDEFGDKLEQAARERSAQRLNVRRSRRTWIVAVGAVLLLSGFAFSAYQWNDTPPEPAPSAGIVADPGEPLTTSGATTSDPKSGVDGGPICVVAVGSSGGRNGETIAPTEEMRNAISVLSSADSAKFNRGSFMFEMQAVEPRRENLPDTPECARFRHPPVAPPVVCLTELSDPNGGEACATTARIRSGRAFIVEDRIPGARAGTARIFGIAPDGVKSVRLTFRGRPAETDAVENVQVIDNAFAFEYNGSAAVPPTVELIPRTAE